MSGRNDSDSDHQLILSLVIQCRQMGKPLGQGFHLLDTGDNKKISATEVQEGLARCGKDISKLRAKSLIKDYVKPGGQMDHAGYLRFISSLPNPVLTYWLVQGRSNFAQAMLIAGKVPYEIDSDTANSWPAPKSDMPFENIPVLQHGDLVLGQSGAITRYCARLAGLYPSDSQEIAKCDMYLDQIMDMFGAIFKGKNAPDKDSKIAAWKMLETEYLPKHFKMFEKNLVNSGKPFLGGDKPNAADVAFFAVYGIYEWAGLDLSIAMEDCPTLEKAHAETCQFGGLPDFPQRNLFFSSDPENAAF